MVRNFILLSLILIICASCGTSLFSRNSRDEYEIREVQNLSEKLRVKIIAKADSLMIERGVKLDRYVSSIGENDLFYFVIYQGIGFRGAPTISLSKENLDIMYFMPGK